MPPNRHRDTLSPGLDQEDLPDQPELQDWIKRDSPDHPDLLDLDQEDLPDHPDLLDLDQEDLGIYIYIYLGPFQSWSLDLRV